MNTAMLKAILPLADLSCTFGADAIHTLCPVGDGSTILVDVRPAGYALGGAPVAVSSAKARLAIGIGASVEIVSETTGLRFASGTRGFTVDSVPSEGRTPIAPRADSTRVELPAADLRSPAVSQAARIALQIERKEFRVVVLGADLQASDGHRLVRRPLRVPVAPAVVLPAKAALVVEVLAKASAACAVAAHVTGSEVVVMGEGAWGRWAIACGAMPMPPFGSLDAPRDGFRRVRVCASDLAVLAKPFGSEARLAIFADGSLAAWDDRAPGSFGATTRGLPGVPLAVLGHEPLREVMGLAKGCKDEHLILDIEPLGMVHAAGAVLAPRVQALPEWLTNALVEAPPASGWARDFVSRQTAMASPARGKRRALTAAG